MAWTMSGTYAASCSRRLVCPCPVDGTPTGPEDQCHGAAVFHIADGEEGGPFGDLSALYGDWLGTERGEISFSEGDRPSFEIGDASVTFEPLEAPDGTATIRP
jgi:hypothetical protein